MKKIKLVLCLICCVIFFGIGANAEETAHKEISNVNFDNITTWNGNGTSGGNGSYSGLWANYGANTEFCGAAAPDTEGKLSGASVSDEQNDNALMINFINKSSENFFFSKSISEQLSGKLSISFNIYVEEAAAAAHSMLQCDLRSSSNNSVVCNLFALRNSRQLQIYYENTSRILSYETKQWYNLRFEIDTVNRCFSFYMNDDLVEGLSDVSLANQKIYFDGDSFSDASGAVKFNQIRFSSWQSNVSGTKYYFDDLIICRGAEPQEPEFVKTVNSLGEENTGLTGIKKDIERIVVRFPCPMDAESFNERVKLYYGNNISVPFAGELDSEGLLYTVRLKKSAYPFTTYSLVFEKGIKTSSMQDNTALSNIVNDSDYTISFTTEEVDFAITDLFFTASEDPNDMVENISGLDGRVYGNVSLVSTDKMTQMQEITVILGLYSKTENGGLLMRNMNFITQNIEICPTESKNITIKVPLDLEYVDENTVIGIFAWDNLNDKSALTETVFLTNE